MRCRARHRAAAAGLVLGVVAGLFASPGLSSPAQAGLDWQRCGGRFECARLVVPMDYARPGGRKLTLALIRLQARGPSPRIGSLVLNPGGPGGSGVDWLREAAGVFSRSVRERFDLVSFDPRGVGRSAPVRCRTAAQHEQETTRDPMPLTATGRAELVADARRLAQACLRRHGGLLPHLTTEATARDLDRLRAALGDRRLTYMGLSYGTVLGATYASIFPARVRALALDGAADPKIWAGNAETFLRVQTAGFQRAYTAFLAWCRGHRSSCAFASDGDPAASIRRLLARLHAKPVTVRTWQGRRLLTERLAITGIAAALYARGNWPFLGSVGEELSGTDGGTLVDFADSYTGRRANGTYTNIQDAYTAISCVDHAPASRNPTSYARLAAQLARISPLLGGAVGYELLPCAFWPVKAASRYTGPFDAAGAPPILVIGTTGDPATPYPWAKALASRLDSGVLLTRVGHNHIAYGVSACVRRLVDRYLLAGTPPRKGTVCRS